MSESEFNGHEGPEAAEGHGHEEGPEESKEILTEGLEEAKTEDLKSHNERLRNALDASRKDGPQTAREIEKDIVDTHNDFREKIGLDKINRTDESLFPDDYKSEHAIVEEERAEEQRIVDEKAADKEAEDKKFEAIYAKHQKREEREAYEQKHGKGSYPDDKEESKTTSPEPAKAQIKAKEFNFEQQKAIKNLKAAGRELPISEVRDEHEVRDNHQDKLDMLKFEQEKDLKNLDPSFIEELKSKEQQDNQKKIVKIEEARQKLAPKKSKEETEEDEGGDYGASDKKKKPSGWS